MNILVTGCSGFIGSKLCLYLLNKGYQVYGLSRNIKNPSLITLLEYNRFTLTEIDLSIANTELLIKNIDSIIHVAAQSPYNAKTFNDYISNNIVATQNIINFALKESITKIIFTSSISIYGNITDAIINENTSINEPDFYGLSKYVCEKMLQKCSENINSMAIRLPGIVGKTAHSPWLAKVLKQAKHNQAITFYNPDAPFNNILHIDSLIEFIEHLCQYDFTGFNSVTLAAKKEKTINSILRKILAITHSKSKLIVSGSQLYSFTISNKKAIEKFGYNPLTVDKSIERFLKQEDLKQQGVING